MSTTILKQSPTALVDWLTSEYPHIPPTVVHFLEGGTVDQTRLNPYASRVIILYRTSDARIYLRGCIFYGSEDICPLLALSQFVPPIDVPLLVDTPNPLEAEVTMDMIKAHIGGTYFSLETLKIILTIGPYVRGFLGFFLKREMQRNLLHLLARFGLERMQDEDVTVDDYQALWYSSQRRLNPCPIWFEVPMHEYGFHPGGVPPYPGGYYHINATQMNVWIWRKLTINCAVKRPGMEHPEQAVHIIEHIREVMEGKKRRKHISLTEIGDIEKRLAPCMQLILGGAGKFPKDRERQQVVRVLAKVGAPIEYVEQKLTVLNDKDPHESGKMALRARWDYKAHYKAGYSAPNCDVIACCPMAPGKSIDMKKSECYLLFGKRFPEKSVPPWKSFYGPAQWFEW